jgi:hypothetical protein
METIEAVSAKYRLAEPEIQLFFESIGERYELDSCWIGACSVRTILRMILTQLTEDQLLAFMLKEIQDVCEIRSRLQ